jgi:hypothetical protein
MTSIIWFYLYYMLEMNSLLLGDMAKVSYYGIFQISYSIWWYLNVFE